MLLVVLVVVAVLALAGYRFADSATADVGAAVRATEAAKLRGLAAAGVAYAAAALADPATVAGFGGDPTDIPAFADVAVGPDGGRFTVFAVADTHAGAGEGRYVVRPGAADESGKLNVNALMRFDRDGKALHDALVKLPNATEELADAIADWVDADDSPRPAGAEASAYPDYRPKNGPLDTLDELLLVRGVTPALLYGTDRNRNGRADPDEPGDFSRGWSEFLTVYGREVDVDAAGNPRLALNDPDPKALMDQLSAAVDPAVAEYVVRYRLTGKADPVKADQKANGTAAQLSADVRGRLNKGDQPTKRLSSVLALADTRVTLPKPADAPRDAPDVVVDGPLNGPDKLKELLPKLLDRTTPRRAFELTPRVNVNTAPREVLAALPGLTAADVDAVLSARGSLPADDPAARTGAWLVTAGGLSAAKFRAIERYVTGRGGVYRVQSVGSFAAGGPAARVEAVIDAATPTPRVLYFRDLSSLGRGLPRSQ